MKKIIIIVLFTVIAISIKSVNQVYASYDECYFDPSLCEVTTPTWTYIETAYGDDGDCGKDCVIEHKVVIYADNSTTETYLVEKYTSWITPSTVGNVLQESYSKTTGIAVSFSVGIEWGPPTLKISGTFGMTWDSSETRTDTYTVNPINPSDPIRMSRMVASATGTEYKVDFYERRVDGGTTSSWILAESEQFWYLNFNTFLVHEQVCYLSTATQCNIIFDQNYIS